MKRKILVAACYILEAEKDEFWDKDSGYLINSNDKYLKDVFPEKMEFPNGLKADRYYIKHQIIDYPQYNFLVCPICTKALTDPSKPNPIHELDKCVTVEGVELCSSCAYQLDSEIKEEGIANVLKKHKKEV
jgi:hypothetical protein